MIKYKSQYEAYYSQLKDKVDTPKVKVQSNSDSIYSQLSSGYSTAKGKESSGNLGKRIFTKLIFQTIVSLLLFSTIVAAKYNSNPKVNEIYKRSKEMLGEKLNYEEFIEDINLLPYKFQELISKSF